MSTLSPQGRRLLELARGQDHPDEMARNRVARALSLKIAAGATLTAAGTSATALGAVVAKSALILGFSGALAGGGWVAWRTYQAPPPAVASRPPATHVAAPTPAVHEENEPAWEPPAYKMPQESVKAPVYHRPNRILAPAEPPAPSPALKQDGLREETEALRLAQQALRDKDPERALRLLDEQDRRFQPGLLPQERSAARILALCQASRVSEAREQATRFERQWPRSALLGRVRSACWDR